MKKTTKAIVTAFAVIISALLIISQGQQLHEPTIPYIHLMPNNQSTATPAVEKMFHETNSDPMFVNNQRTITALPQKQVLIKERLEIKFNNNLTTEQKIVKTSELEKTENEKKTVTTEPQQATVKPLEHINSKPMTPSMGDTRIVNGQKQVYFLGFGWIEDGNKTNEEIAAKDMFENGNKVGNMEGSTVMDSDGDIDKMVGTMGD